MPLCAVAAFAPNKPPALSVGFPPKRFGVEVEVEDWPAFPRSEGVPVVEDDGWAAVPICEELPRPDEKLAG